MRDVAVQQVSVTKAKQHTMANGIPKNPKQSPGQDIFARNNPQPIQTKMGNRRSHSSSAYTSSGASTTQSDSFWEQTNTQPNTADSSPVKSPIKSPMKGANGREQTLASMHFTGDVVSTASDAVAKR